MSRVNRRAYGKHIASCEECFNPGRTDGGDYECPEGLRLLDLAFDEAWDETHKRLSASKPSDQREQKQP